MKTYIALVITIGALLALALGGFSDGSDHATAGMSDGGGWARPTPASFSW